MKRIIFKAIGFFLCLRLSPLWALELEWNELTRASNKVNCVLLNKDNPERIYVGTNKSLAISEDSGSSWKDIPLGGSGNNVNFIAQGRQGNYLYAATARGLFASNGSGARWQRIFKGRSSQESECRQVVILPEAFFLATRGGLFISVDSGRNWQKVPGRLGKLDILALDYSPKQPGLVFAACAEGVFKTEDNGASWEKVFSAVCAENGIEDDSVEDDLDEPEKASIIRYFIVDSLGRLCLATSEGVYLSLDRGKTWERVPDAGLLKKEVHFLSSFNGYLVALNKSGAFILEGQLWQELSLGVCARDYNFISHDKYGSFYLATEKGLYRSSPSDSKCRLAGKNIEQYTRGEPQIKQVQQAAIKYAEVESEKIMRWRKQAAKKAILPQVSAGVSRNVTDLWHWESGSTTKNEDDTLRRGQDAVEWDVSLSWDLGELIWNDDQTSIDVRSRLMVQLRDDILDEVNKTYFERIRVKAELDGIPIEDKKRQFEKQLRLKELTASLDGLTGGYFSQQLE